MGAAAEPPSAPDRKLGYATGLVDPFAEEAALLDQGMPCCAQHSDKRSFRGVVDHHAIVI
jgi:hypothetical protein